MDTYCTVYTICMKVKKKNEAGAGPKKRLRNPSNHEGIFQKYPSYKLRIYKKKVLPGNSV